MKTTIVVMVRGSVKFLSNDEVLSKFDSYYIKVIRKLGKKFLHSFMVINGFQKKTYCIVFSCVNRP